MHFSMKKSYKPKIIGLLIVLSVLWLIGVCVYRIDKLYSMRAASYASNMGTDIVNTAVNNVLEKNPQYDEFIQVIKDAENRVTATENNTRLMNLFKSELTIEIQKITQNYPMLKVNIPLGNISGLAIFNNRGVNIPIRLAPVSNIKTDFYSELKNSGINNTKHSLYIDVEMELEMLSYFSQTREIVHTTVPVSETLIAGDIPAYFSDSGYIGYVPEKIE